MILKRTKTTETFILPEQFDVYTKKGFIIMYKPTVFNTYRAIKVELIENDQSTSFQMILDWIPFRPLRRLMQVCLLYSVSLRLPIIKSGFIKKAV